MCPILAHSDTNHDAYRWAVGGLCKSGGEVLEALLQAGGPVHQNDVAAQTGRGVRTVQRKCRQFYGLGLAEPAAERGRGWWGLPLILLRQSPTALTVGHSRRI